MPSLLERFFCLNYFHRVALREERSQSQPDYQKTLTEKSRFFFKGVQTYITYHCKKATVFSQ